MKDRLVFWGKKEKEQKVLITIDLHEDEGTYDVQVIKGSDVTEEFDTMVRNEWRNNAAEINFPEILEKFTKELSLTQDILPHEYEVDREDLLKMAQAEWNFFVLSRRLKNAYNNELEDYEEQIEKLEDYSQDLWNKMKNFWGKVQKQIRERNLARRHGNDLRKRTNAIFSTLKALRAESEKKFNAESSAHRAKFMDQLKTIEKKMEGGQSLRNLFDQLKKIQNEFKKYRFTRQDHSAVWDKLDGLFKEVKTRKYGQSAHGSDPLEKSKRRVDGLSSAVDRMKRSISKDKKELKFQKSKIERADGQLEAQIRQAKLVMLEERINSKQAKLDDMLKTEKQLNQRVAKLKAQAEKDKAQQKIKDRIAKEMQEKQDKLKQDPEILKAAAEITGKSAPAGNEILRETVEVIQAAVTASQSIQQEEE